ncbi:hypothetical protein ACHAWF_018144, partial [Thalassiosira exigua]
VLRREFVLLLSSSSGERGYVDVAASDTLADVRRRVLEDFDEEVLPGYRAGREGDGRASDDDAAGGGSSSASADFAFRVDGVRIMSKQEGRRNAFDLLDRGAAVELAPKRVPSRVPSKRPAEDEGLDGSAKRARTAGIEATAAAVLAGEVTPFEGTPGSEGGNDNDDGDVGDGDDEDDARDDDGDGDPEGGDDAADVAMAPVRLDDKFAASEGGEGAVFAPAAAASDNGREDSDAADGFESIEASEGSTSRGEAVEDVAAGAADEATPGAEGVDAGARAGPRGPGGAEGVEVDDVDEGGVAGGVVPDDDATDEATADADVASEAHEETDVAADEVPPDQAPGADGADGRLQSKRDDPDPVDDDVLEASGRGASAAKDPHEESDAAKEMSREVLTRLASILEENEDFCSEARRREWLEDIDGLLGRGSPRTVFGVLGNTGVGKSSLLNSLLDEAAVLPTSGSRGCTATVVELVFHSDLTKDDGRDEDIDSPQSTVPVYKGEVQFITLEDWRKELKVLVEECSTQDKTIYVRCPDASVMPDAAQAWQKIEQVYGKRSMEKYCRKPTEYVYTQLANDMRVKRLLTATIPGQGYNSIVVDVGEVAPGSDEALELLRGHGQMKSAMKAKKKNWAQEFRKRINTYVYRAGNGDQPQTWPLIRKVQLRGPWSVLSTGAVLVDLPGVRDSNAARAKVAEGYLQNCNQIAIVAPIKRAVDDGTAKELLGEQFRRRLLMDGQYGNVFFVCTQTDDIEATETMRDHADVAKEEPGRWDKMTGLAEGISNYETRLYPLLQKEEDLEGQVEDAKQQLKDSKEDLKQAEEEEEGDIDFMENLEAVIADNEAALVTTEQDLARWRQEHSSILEKIQGKCDRLQKKLKALCSAVRNEYSKSCLQADFKSGLKELYRKDDDDGNGNQSEIPDEYEMDVFCISANDYLKLMKIKASRDGPPSTFSNPRDTQIPQLRQYVHEATARSGTSAVRTFVENTNDVLDQMKLLAGDVDDVPTGRSAFRMKSTFEHLMRDVSKKIDPIAGDFQRVLDQKIQGEQSTRQSRPATTSLASSLRSGAKKGSAVAMSTVHSWGSTNRRTKNERRPDKNGLYYSTYNAVARRDGVYTSQSAGAIDFNQELCDPSKSM